EGVRQWRATGKPPPDIAAAEPAAAAAVTAAAPPAVAAPSAAAAPPAASAAEGAAQPKLIEPDSPAHLVARPGPGQALDGATASRMSDAFGESFAGVRIHTDATAAQMAADREARAFTVGSHIAFRAGAYAPGTPAGDALVAHELAHVVQQSGAG